MRIVRICAWLVPADRRATWRQQWMADLAAQAAFLHAQGHASPHIRRDLTRRSFGALRHACWLRIHQWRTLMTAQDFRYAVRGFRQRPGFTAAIVMTLGLAIGATTTIFSWMDALVLNPLPGVPRASELVLVRFATPSRTDLSFSYPNYRDVRDAAPAALRGIAVKNMMATTVRIDDGAPERVWIEVASGNLFDVLGVGALHGRVLQPEDERERRPVAVISHALWTTRFQGDAGIVGRGVSVNGVPLTVVGVAPEAFRGAMGGLAMDLWLPITLHPQLTGRDVTEGRGNGFLTAIARLAPGATAAEADTAVRVISDRMVADELINEHWRLRVAPLSEDGAAMVLMPVVSVLMALVVLVLLIACANVSGLLLARAVARQHELAVRTALGAGRWRLVRQLLLESILLAAAGGLAGVLLAQWTSRGLGALLPPLPYPILIDATVNLRVLGFSLVVVAVATVLFGLVPALQGSRTRLLHAVRASRASSSTPGRARLRSALVVAQVALALVLLVCAGLFLRTLSNAYDVDPGFTRRHAVLASFDLSALRLDEIKGRALLDRILERVDALPGVERASASTFVPLSIGGGSDTSPAIEGYTRADGEEVVVYYGMVAPGYFDTLGIPLVAGRAIDDRDRATSAPVVIINETMARRYWAGRDPLGGRLRSGTEWATVIGVARDGKYGQLVEAPRSVMYFPIQQVYRSAPVLQVATTGPAGVAIDGVRRAVAEVAPDLALYDVRTLEEHLRMSVAIPRMAALLLGIFGGLALLLSAVGLSGVIAFSVSQRTQEIGVRMALGADRGRVLRSVLGQGARLAAFGVALGLAGAALATPLLDSLLVNVSPTDPLTFAATAAGLMLVALLAAWIPARRAAGLDPVNALRAE
jgi:macrolide transport system ATP-binding/permease protein